MHVFVCLCAVGYIRMSVCENLRKNSFILETRPNSTRGSGRNSWTERKQLWTSELDTLNAHIQTDAHNIGLPNVLKSPEMLIKRAICAM